MTTEHDRMEAHRAFAMNEYFKAYPYRNDHTHPRAFNVGFHLGWEAHRDVSEGSEGVVERAKKLGIVAIPFSEVLDEMEQLRAALSALQNAPCALSLSADFDELTWTFQMTPDFQVSNGFYALVKIAEADEKSK
jgi:hypothetical protein